MGNQLQTSTDPPVTFLASLLRPQVTATAVTEAPPPTPGRRSGSCTCTSDEQQRGPSVAFGFVRDCAGVRLQTGQRERFGEDPAAGAL